MTSSIRPRETVPWEREAQESPSSEMPPLSETPRKLTNQRDTPLDSPVDNTNRNFKGQQKNEVVQCFTRRHWIVLAPYFLAALIMAIIIPSYILFVDHPSLRSFFDITMYRVLAFAAVLLVTHFLHYFFLRLFNYYLQIVVITNSRVIHLNQTLYFQRERDSIDLPEIQDIVIQRRGILKTLLNYGEITITLSSAHATKTLTHIPNPDYYFRKLNKIKSESFRGT